MKSGLFREENIPLNAELSTREQKYGEIAGAMSVELNGKTLTLQQAANFLREPNRGVRQSAYEDRQPSLAGPGEAR